uniref:DNA topoisomerase n=1 Tax=Panagrolaimus superbus TaxID=310955 RepID=A0A914Y164_9BILA
MDYMNWKVTDLKDKLRELGQPVSGKKAELIDRLQSINLQHPSCSGRLVIDAKPSSSRASSGFDSMTIPQLKAELTKYKLPVSGKRKEELVQRLESYFECQLTGPIDFDFIGRRPIELLMVAEKPSMAQELSHMLAQSSRVNRSSCSNDAIPVFRFSMMFHGYPANVRMTSTLGHIYKQEFGPEVTRNQTEELFEADVINTEANPEKRIPKMLAEIGKGSDALILWLDCDLEGEAICFEVIDCVKNVMIKPPSGNVMDVIYRAKFSSSDEATTAINNLVKPNFRYHLAALAKHDLDLRVGVSFSRYQTSLLRRAFPDRNIDHLSFGPCQSPCLHFCVKQHEKLEAYVPTYTCHIVIALDLGRYELEITSDPIKNQQEADKIYQKLKAEQRCKVVSVERTTHVKEPPKALNTVELLKDASKQYGIGPSETMSAAEYLYTSGLISYPRTETTRYPKNLNLQDKKNKLRRMLPSFPATQSGPALPAIGGRRVQMDDFEEPMDWETIVEKEEVYERGDDKGDHPPIIPTGKAVIRTLNSVQKLVYELVCRRFFASFMPEQRYHSEVTVFSAADVTFKRKIQEIDDYGFAKLLPWEKAPLTRDVPTGILSNGSQIKIKSIKISKTKSTSPTLLSEYELIDKMEKHSIGTDASIPSHIANIQRRNYITVNEETRTLVPTKLGLQLIKAYRECIPKLVETSLRADFEKQIMNIAKGESEFEQARRFILDAFKEQFKIFRNNFHKFTINFEGCFEMKVEGTYGRNGYRNNQNSYNQQPSSSLSVDKRKIIHASRQITDQKTRVEVAVKSNKPVSQYAQHKPFPAVYDRCEQQVAPKVSPVKRRYVILKTYLE